MMKPVRRVNGEQASATEGNVVFDPIKSLWIGSMLGISLVLAPVYFSWTAFLVFLLLSYTTLLIGHSVGMHRMMIHRSFDCPKPLERALIFIGVLVGMGGPIGVIKIHDSRDWAQRQEKCHDFFSHNRSYLKDISWQLFYKFEFKQPPKFSIESNLTEDKWIMFFERSWRLQQLVLAIPLYLLGGLPWLVWGICVRVSVSIIGHWTITYICHNPGPQKWLVKGASVQASNLRFAGFVSHGECWHNNHHAFPESARIGLEPGQADPAWRVIKVLVYFKLAKNIGVPRPVRQREDLVRTVQHD